MVRPCKIHHNENLRHLFSVFFQVKASRLHVAVLPLVEHRLAICDDDRQAICDDDRRAICDDDDRRAIFDDDDRQAICDDDRRTICDADRRVIFDDDRRAIFDDDDRRAICDDDRLVICVSRLIAFYLYIYYPDGRSYLGAATLRKKENVRKSRR